MALDPPPQTKSEIHRLELQAILTSIVPGESLPAYLQPGPTVTLNYPCITYRTDKPWVFHADNRKYFVKKRWTVTVIDRNPDSDIPDLVLALSQCEFDRFFINGGLNHWVYTLFY